MTETDGQHRYDPIQERLEGDEQEGWALFLDAFFECLDRAELDAAGELLSQVAEYPFRSPDLPSWVAYCQGILAVERCRWADAERIHSRLLDTRLPPELQARVLNELGMVYDYLGRWRESAAVYRHSLSLFESLDDLSYVGKVSKNLGIALTRGAEAGDLDRSALDEAISFHQRALEQFQALGEPQLEGRAWNELGTTYKAAGRWDEAMDCYRKHMALCRQYHQEYELGLSLINIGEVFQHRGEQAQAKASYRKALSLMRDYNDTYEEADVLANLALLYWEQGHPAQALQAYNSAIQVIESLRTNVTSHQARQDFFSTVAHVYGGQVTLCLETDHPDLAFDTVERARSRTLVELLTGSPIRPPQDIPPAWLSEEQLLRTRLEALYQSSAPEIEIHPLEQRLGELRRWIELRDTEYASFRAVSLLTLEQVCSRLPPRTALVEYFGTDQLTAFVVADGRLHTTRLDVSPGQLQKACFDAQGRPHNLMPDPQGALHQPWLLARLRQSLLAPVEPWLEGSETVILVPHGILHYLPLHALEGLGQRQVLYAPSATVLLDYCQSKAPSPHTGCLALGYAGGDTQTGQPESVTRLIDPRPPLHHPEAEAASIARLCGGQAFTGPEATREALYQNARRCRFLHLACRAAFTPASPLSSRLLLADGSLDIEDILRHVSLEADLVSLSACDTGLSRVQAGDELIGLVRAFLYAGTPSVLVTLWRVDDLATRIFMEQFYRERMAFAPLSTALCNTVALQRAQAFLRNLTIDQLRHILYTCDPDRSAVEKLLSRLGQVAGLDAPLSDADHPFAHPYYWAPFILMGDRLPRP